MSNEINSAARQRIEALLDANSFVEIGAGVKARNTDFNMSEKKAPSDGVITGYGLVDGSLVYVYSQDASVLKGTIGEMHAKKIVKIYNLAVKTGAPVVGLVDCAGMRLQEAADGLNAFGEVYLSQTMASGVIPQITGIFGTCGGGMALIPALTDFTFMESEKAKLFVNSPNALKDNTEEKCDTSSAHFQGEKTGMVDVQGTEEEIFAQMRTLLSILPSNKEDDMADALCTDDLNREIAEIKSCASDPALFLPRISDNNVYIEIKPYYGSDMVTALIKLNGCTVGAVANRTVKYDDAGIEVKNYGKVISPEGAGKAAKFINFCDAFSIPIVSFSNASGFEATEHSEINLAREAAALTYAFANATTPKINVITEKAFGSAYVIMNSKSIGADLVYAWKDAKIGMMDAKAAVKLMYENMEYEEMMEKAEEYDALQNSVESAEARGYVDTIIEPEDTRKYLIGALEILFTKREYRPDRKHGTV